MTRVCYYRNEYRLRAEGHAGAGEKGRDLICAAESILMMALERHVSQRPEMRAEILRRPGAEEIRCRPDRGCEGACRESFDTVYAGFALLAGEYPEHVSAREIPLGERLHLHERHTDADSERHGRQGDIRYPLRRDVDGQGGQRQQEHEQNGINHRRGTGRDCNADV